MSAGLETLIKAAKFIEQQEQLKLSPPQTVAPSILNDQRFIVHCAAGVTAASYDANGHHNSNNNSSSSNIITTTRNINARHHTAALTTNHHHHQHAHQVSSSAPAAAATFQHANGLTITSSSNSNSNSQLVTATTNHHNNDYEFSNGNVIVGGGSNSGSGSAGSLTIVATPATAAAVAAAATINGRSSEGRMSEDVFSSSNILTFNNNKNQHNTIPPNSNSNGLILLPMSTNAHEQKHQQELQQQQQHLHEMQKHCKNIAKAKTTTLTFVDNTIAENAVVASKQMLLNGGIRIAAPAATIGSTAVAQATTKAINIPQLPPQYNNVNHIITSAHSLSSRHKVSIPLTPPPIPSRKLAEPNQRIRSFSLSSNKISANQSLLLHNGGGSSNNSNSNSSNSNHMIVDDTHMNYVTAATGSSNHSPPRGLASSGNHYMQMMSSAQQGGAGSQVVTHVTPPIGSSGRRRTISSNSNGAGTREVHNKLEKHRRAHLKECYATLKDQLQLKDEDRKKTSNLAILAEALNVVQSLQKQDHNLEGEMEKLAKEKINLQKRSNNLKRELGPKYEQMFSGILPDIDLGSIPNERENINDTVSLSSGRGSMLYSSSSSLSSGGSNGSNTMSSPIGAGLQTAIPTTISPVISKTNSNTTITTNHHHNNTSAVAAATSSVLTTPISPNIQQHFKTSSAAASVSANNSPNGSPTAALNGIVSANNSLPLSLTAKNISATSLTRGSPTPSTPSPSPSSSSGVSSSSSLISSSPPINGVISGRSVTVNIPNGLKFQTNGGATIGTIGNSTASAAATIIATSPPGGNIVAAAGGVNGANSNNAHAHATAAVTVAAAHNTNAPNGYRQQHGRKTSLSIGDDSKNLCNSNNAIIAMKNADKRDYEDGEQPAKFIKVYNGLITTSSAEHIATTPGASVKQMMITPPTLNASSASTAAVMGQLQLTQVVGGGSLVVSPSSYAATTVTASPASSSTASTVLRSHMPAAHMQQVLINGSSITSEIGRLPGGAELNILPTNGVVAGGALKSQTGCSTAATTFYHANGKLPTSLVNGGTAAGGNSGFLLKDNNLVMPVTTTATALQLAAAGSTSTGFTPLIVAASAHSNSNANNSIQYTYAGNFAQLIAATSGAAATTTTATHMQNIIAANNAPSSSCIDRLNGKSFTWRTGTTN